MTDDAVRARMVARTLRLCHAPVKPVTGFRPGAGAWAASVADRYRHGTDPSRHRAQPVLVRAAWPSIEARYFRTEWHIAPRVSLAVTRTAGPARAHLDRDRRRPDPPTATPWPVVPIAERLLARNRKAEEPLTPGALGGRGTRASSRAAASPLPRSARGSSREDLASFRPVGRVVHRPATVGSPPACGSATWTEEPAPTSSRAWPVAATSFPPAVVADFEVERITERVVRALDRRVVAQRERTGGR